MAIFRVEITEILSRVIEVEADSPDAAREQACTAYSAEDIVLDSSDYNDTTFSIVED
ncbi:MAG: DpnD/PcfM family protein [Rothia sp. (in: high G+C Gram-positive bacteria)]|uniref:DpnD/PcfM family protein n=1 Tax=Rothia sp. (in: high G+C Gram-positive bacteria) TaxID=1885016 RepID=UPI0026DFB2B8|nr:DpnD/PcfM family protein [Rothia sp. (in: high G+C Gram-positive bacteria)]MDO5750704.1 DpnD/PcfM family protein [Rothia sp. (in: high G+C Gram-positive bacteria)]